MEDDFSLLLVEPEEEQQKLIEEVLRSEFEIVDIATSPTSMEAMSLLSAQGDVQCIIVSSTLDDSSGFSLISDIRAISKYAKTPVLIMSDIQERDHLLKAAASGASDFIVKPFDSRSLALKLKKLLADKQFRKSTRISTLGAYEVSVCFEEATYKCTLIDISVGGCSIKTQPFSRGGVIFDKATINIDNNGIPLIINAEFARAERDPECEDKESKFQLAGFQFITPDNETIEAISAFINGVGN